MTEYLLKKYLKSQGISYPTISNKTSNNISENAPDLNDGFADTSNSYNSTFDYNKTILDQVHTSIGKFAGMIGLFCNLLLFIAKLAIGIISNSVAIKADAFNNLSDASSSIVVLLGFKMAQQPADEDHPYGHARYEYLSGLAVAILIIILGIELAKSSITKILNPEPVAITTLTWVILILSIATKVWMAHFYKKLSTTINSTALSATSTDCRNDSIATFAVLISCLVQHFFNINIDGWIGILVAIFILISGINTARETISPLLGQKADDKLITEINNIILSHNGILGAHALLIHDYGPGKCYASIHVELSASYDSLKCHEIIDHIENEVLERLNIHLVIHLDPVKENPK